MGTTTGRLTTCIHLAWLLRQDAGFLYSAKRVSNTACTASNTVEAFVVSSLSNIASSPARPRRLPPAICTPGSAYSPYHPSTQGAKDNRKGQLCHAKNSRPSVKRPCRCRGTIVRGYHGTRIGRLRLKTHVLRGESTHARSDTLAVRERVNERAVPRATAVGCRVLWQCGVHSEPAAYPTNPAMTSGLFRDHRRHAFVSTPRVALSHSRVAELLQGLQTRATPWNGKTNSSPSTENYTSLAKYTAVSLVLHCGAKLFSRPCQKLMRLVRSGEEEVCQPCVDVIRLSPNREA